MKHESLLQLAQSIIDTFTKVAVAHLAGLKSYLSKNTFSVRVANPTTKMKVEGEVKVSNTQPLLKALGGVVLAINGLKKPIMSKKEVEVSNLKDLKLPSFPSEVRVSNPQKEVKITNMKEFTNAVEKVAEFIAKIKYDPRIEVKPADVKLKAPVVNVAAPIVNVPEQKPPVVNVEAPDLSDIKKLMEFFESINAKNPIAVRLSDGQKYYKALEKMAEIYAGSTFSAFQDEGGADARALIDEERHLQVDVVTAPQPAQDIDFITRMVIKNLLRLNMDASGRLRVASEATTLAANQDIRTLTNLTNWGLLTATARTQVDSYQSYQQGFRKNLTVTA